MKFEFIEEQKKAYPTSLLCNVLQVSRSGYSAWLNRPEKAETQEPSALIQRVRQIHEETGGIYGSRRISAQLKKEGHPVGRYQARSLMKQAQVQVERRRPQTRTTDSKKSKSSTSN